MTSWEGSVSSAPKTGTTVDFLGMTMAFRLTGKDTGGLFSITDQCALPGTGPDFLHTHPAHETFIVMEGEFAFYGQADGKKVERRMGPGSIHHVGSNAPHGFKNVGTTVGRAMLIFHPADLQESFFTEFGRPGRPDTLPQPLAGPPSPEELERWQTIFQKHKLVMLEQPKF